MWRSFKAKSISSVKRKSLWNTTGRDECILILRDFHYERNLNNSIWKHVLKWFLKIDLSLGFLAFYHWMWPKRSLKTISHYRLVSLLPTWQILLFSSCCFNEVKVIMMTFIKLSLKPLCIALYVCYNTFSLRATKIKAFFFFFQDGCYDFYMRITKPLMFTLFTEIQHPLFVLL